MDKIALCHVTRVTLMNETAKAMSLVSRGLWRPLKNVGVVPDPYPETQLQWSFRRSQSDKLIRDTHTHTHTHSYYTWQFHRSEVRTVYVNITQQLLWVRHMCINVYKSSMPSVFMDPAVVSPLWSGGMVDVCKWMGTELNPEVTRIATHGWVIHERITHTHTHTFTVSLWSRKSQQ